MDGHKSVPPYALLKLLKAAYGLQEAPRLQYLKLRSILAQICFVELRCARAVFVLQEQGRLVTMLTVHVDDENLRGNALNLILVYLCVCGWFWEARRT